MEELPQNLQQIVEFYEGLSDDEKREALIGEAEQVEQYAPQKGESFAVEDVRKDSECSDKVGIFVRKEEDGSIFIRIQLGEKVQTLTRALSVILCRGLEGCSAQDIEALPRL